MEEIVLPALVSDGGRRTMAGEHGDGVVEGEEFLADAVAQQLAVAARKVPASDAPAEEDVAADEGIFPGEEKTQASRAMARHVENAHIRPEQPAGMAFVHEEIRRERLEVEREPPLAEKPGIGGDRRGVRVEGGAAVVPADDGGGIGDVVEMPVGEREQGDGCPGEGCVGALRRVKKDGARRGLVEVAIRVEHAAGKYFEPFHGLMVFRNVTTKFDFPNRLCKFPLMKRVDLGSRWLAAVAAAVLLPAVLQARSSVEPGEVARQVASWLERGHYTRHKLDEQMSRRFLQTYLTTLDYNKLYFTQKDVTEFETKYGATLGGTVLKGDLGPAREIFARFKERLESRVAKNEKLARQKFAFDSSRSVEVNRQDLPWPADEAEADRIWRGRVEAELLKEQLAEVKLRTPQETVVRRYKQVLRNVQEMEDGDVVKTFLSSLAQTYDPHSEYLSPSDLENFQIQMKLSLVGVGAVLSSEDGYAKVKEVVAGGPADRDGRLAVNDRIAAVAQGDAEFEDVVDMKLDKVVEKIRGKKGSIVKLLVIPAEATDPSKRKVVEIRRDEVKLKDAEARAEIIDLGGDKGSTTRVGWITLPSFYANMDNRGPAKSTTEDVNALIERLKREGIQGLVIDLRRDGGGSLEEAVNLTGLFIPKGPVVQAKDTNGRISFSQDTDPSVAYSGPLIVVVNRLSASASEIFAAALQDYGRAVIVGDERTFGKGTVQTVLDLGRSMPIFSLGAADAGALKLTIQKFYRVRGGSTQLNGVESDIVLPSLTDTAEIGEGSLKNRLSYDEVAPMKISDGMASQPLFLDDLRTRSSQRISSDPEFVYITDDMRRMLDKIEQNTISLNEKERRKELAEEKARREQRDTERQNRGPALVAQAYELKLDDLVSPTLRPVAFDRKPERAALVDEETEEDKAKSNFVAPDPIRNEALRIMRDFIDLTANSRTASIQPVNP